MTRAEVIHIQFWYFKVSLSQITSNPSALILAYPYLVPERLWQLPVLPHLLFLHLQLYLHRGARVSFIKREPDHPVLLFKILESTYFGSHVSPCGPCLPSKHPFSHLPSQSTSFDYTAFVQSNKALQTLPCPRPFAGAAPLLGTSAHRSQCGDSSLSTQMSAPQRGFLHCHSSRTLPTSILRMSFIALTTK